jgi:hypothetical protein
MKEHKHAELLRLAADNAGQLFECDSCIGGFSILYVLNSPSYNWRPVKQTKKIKRWLWADKDGHMIGKLMTDTEKDYYNNVVMPYTTLITKLLWSETEFEVDYEKL